MNNKDIINHKKRCLNILDNYLEDLSQKNSKKVELISYWLEDYTRYLKMEDNFQPNMLKRYERGDIIKVNLGFNVGSEEGGLHYCTVLDNDNKRNSPVITVIPLSSKKENKKINEKYQIELGNQIYEKLSLKANTLLKYCNKEINKINNQLVKIENETDKLNTKEINFLKVQIENVEDEYERLKKIISEIEKMKEGSIALVNQITTISKQRIYNPKNNYDILSGIKLSADNLEIINQKLTELYIHKK